VKNDHLKLINHKSRLGPPYLTTDGGTPAMYL